MPATRNCRKWDECIALLNLGLSFVKASTSSGINLIYIQSIYFLSNCRPIILYMPALFFLHNQVQFETKVAIPFCKNDTFLYLYHIFNYITYSVLILFVICTFVTNFIIIYIYMYIKNMCNVFTILLL